MKVGKNVFARIKTREIHLTSFILKNKNSLVLDLKCKFWEDLSQQRTVSTEPFTSLLKTKAVSWSFSLLVQHDHPHRASYHYSRVTPSKIWRIVTVTFQMVPETVGSAVWLSNQSDTNGLNVIRFLCSTGQCWCPRPGRFTQRWQNPFEGSQQFLPWKELGRSHLGNLEGDGGT